MINCIKELLDNQQKNLKLYALGALFFFVGIGLIQGADKLMEPSLRQEVYALVGIGAAGAGFIIAMLAQLLLIISRFRKIGQRNR